jgi:hypothetical protein
MMKAPRILPQYIVAVAKNGWARAAYEDVATFQSNVVIGLNKPSPVSDSVRRARRKLFGAIQVIQLKVDKAVNR